MSITLESLVHLQADRDELLQLLSLLNTHWHQNEEAFCNRSLAEWPQWCEDQGFRFALLTDLAHNLESTLTYPEGCPRLDPLITALGPAATTAQLLDSLDQDLPQFLEGFDQLLQISQDETAALGAQAGGTGKAGEYLKTHPWVDAAVGVVGLSAAVGYVSYRYWRAKQAAQRRVEQQERELRQREEQFQEIEVESFDDNQQAQANIWNALYRKRYGIKDELSQTEAQTGEDWVIDIERTELKNLSRSVQSEAIEFAGSKLDIAFNDTRSEVIKRADSTLDQALASAEKKGAEDAQEALNNELEAAAEKEVDSVKSQVESEAKAADIIW